LQGGDFFQKTHAVTRQGFGVTAGFKLKANKCESSRHGDSADERHFGPPSAQKMMHEKNKRTRIVKWPDLEEIRNWLADHRNSKLCVYKISHF
jgi:hypothetical protein